MNTGKTIQKIIEDNGYVLLKLTNKYTMYNDKFGTNLMSKKFFLNIHKQAEKEEK